VREKNRVAVVGYEFEVVARPDKGNVTEKIGARDVNLPIRGRFQRNCGNSAALASLRRN